jgi:hypothetical protein
MTTSKIKGLIFDIGGTLFFSDKTNLTNAGKKLLIYLKKHGIIINEKADAFGQYIKAQNKKYKEYCNKMNDIEISPYELVTKF